MCYKDGYDAVHTGLRQDWGLWPRVLVLAAVCCPFCLLLIKLVEGPNSQIQPARGGGIF